MQHVEELPNAASAPVVARRVIALVRRRPLAGACISVLVVITVASALASFLAPYNPDIGFPTERWLGPSQRFPLGTDQLGRDLLSRLLFGGQVSLLVSFTASILGTTLGGMLGLVSAYTLGALDHVTQRVMDVLLAFPAMVLALALAAMLGASLVGVTIAIAVPLVPIAARVIRARALSVREMEFVQAARSVGAGSWRIIFVHMLPQCVAPYIVILTAHIGWAIVVEASLGFLGVSVAPPTATWGGLLNRAVDAMLVSPTATLFPGLMISITVFSVNILGDSLRDELDPRLRGL